MNSNINKLIDRARYEPYLVRGACSLERVGFFDDGLSRDRLCDVLNDRRWVTPTSHLAPNGVVLCTTGAFSPLHIGHIRMLEIAKAELEAKGVIVAGALIQPDHDDYVSRKSGGAASCDAATRIHLAQELTKDIPWIAVDLWAALYQDRALNYTTILRRTERYLGRQVVYVFGSDNAGFKDAFLPHEYVCVGRPKHQDPHPSAIDISSTEVRESCRQSFPAPDAEHPYLIRNDLEWATRAWSPSALTLDDFRADLFLAFLAVWGHCPLVVSAEQQRHHLDHVCHPHISFDRVTGTDHWVSRVFDACTHQHRPVRYLSSDLSTIAPGEYALIDDDIASGSTVAYIKSQTPQVKWTDAIGMTQWVHKGPFFDIVDARDFLFGARLGGLCIRDGDDVYRAPYISPWVNLFQRAKIPPHKQQAFVRAVIEANIRFFAQTHITVAQTDNAAFWQRLGYSLDTTLHSVSLDLLTWNPN